MVRAIDVVERALAIYGPPVYVRHEIVHNRFVVDGLRAKGAVFVEADVTDAVQVAHAVAEATFERFRRRASRPRSPARAWCT